METEESQGTSTQTDADHGYHCVDQVGSPARATTSSRMLDSPKRLGPGLGARETEAASHPSATANPFATHPILENPSAAEYPFRRGSGDMSGDNHIVLGTPSGEVTWRRRQGKECVFREDQELIQPGKSDTRSSGVRCPGGQEKALQGGIGRHRYGQTNYYACAQQDAQVSGSGPMLGDVIYDSRNLYSDRRSESVPLETEVMGYPGGGIRGVPGASSYRILGPGYTHAGADFRALPGNRDVGGDLNPDMPPRNFAYQPVVSHNTMKPPTFDGTTDLSSYLTQFQMICDLNNWTREQRALQLAVSLRGNAAEILNDIPHQNRRDYDLIAETLIQRFQPQNQRRLHVARLRARIRKRNESLDDLANDIKRMVRLAYPDLEVKCKEEMALECFADAINDEQLRRDLIVGGPKTMSEALRLAVEAELSYSRRGSYTRTVQNEHIDPILSRINELERRSTDQVYQRIAQIEENQRKQESGYMKKPQWKEEKGNGGRKQRGQCYLCGSFDHYRRYCPKNNDPQNHPYNKYHNPDYRRSDYQYQQKPPQQNRNNDQHKTQNQGNWK